MQRGALPPKPTPLKLGFGVVLSLHPSPAAPETEPYEDIASQFSEDGVSGKHHPGDTR